MKATELPSWLVQASEAGASRSFPHLPEDIWLQIASKLPTRDWVRASGACAARRGMLLNDIKFVAEHVLG
ncbi:F-box protein, partial [Enterococcus faecium]|uniref:F-box protein n=1 Tax=Enterococcus faecium TaxID=1352 RepID=UPI0039082C78